MSGKIKSQLRYFSQVFGIPVYGLSHLAKRDKNLWVFGSTFGNRFADNPKYFYLYMNQYHKEIRAVWISHDEKIVKYLQKHKLPAYHYHSKEGMELCLRAGVYIYDNYSKDISFWLSGGALKVNLWHGIPLKKIQMDNIFDKVRHPENAWKAFYWKLRRMSDEKPKDYVLTTSENLRPIFSSAFATKHVLTSGYPRNDSFHFPGEIKNLRMPSELSMLRRLGRYGKNLKDEKIPERENNLRGKYLREESRLILYMPTFRESETLFFEKTDAEALRIWLRQKGVRLLIKLHPKSKLRERFLELASEEIFLLAPEADPYVFLPYADALVTDYSSIYFDYLLMDRPVIFYKYDYEEYLSQSRELYFDYEEMTPGRKAADGAGLLEALENIDWEGHTDGYESERKRVRDYVFDNQEEPASKRLYQEILGVMSKK